VRAGPLPRLLIVAWAAAVACACEPPGGSGPPSSAASLTIGLSGNPPLTPITHVLTRQRLVGTTPDGRPTPGLVERWSTSSDGLTWDLVIRPDARQSDGTLVTAHDIAALLLREQAAEDEVPAGLWDIDRIEAPDDRTVRLSLREPTSLLLEALTLTDAPPVGPFALPNGDDETGELPVLLPNTAHSSVPVGISQVAFRRYDNPRAAWAALLREEIDFLYEVHAEAQPFLQQAPGIQVRSFISPFVMTLGLNSSHSVLRRTVVRRALNLAVDRDELLAREFGGRGRVASGYTWPEHWASDPEISTYSYAPDQARHLLDAEGLTIQRRADGPPSRFRITCLVPERFENVAHRLRRAYLAIGVDLVLELVTQEEFAQRAGSGTFEAFISTLGTGLGTNFVYQQWSGLARGRYVHFGYSAAAEAAERLRRARTEDEQRAAFRALQRVLFDDPPAVFLLWDSRSRAIGRRFSVPHDSAGRDILSSLPRWRPTAHAGTVAR
jgi:peptide/nickel transport system substrate-binding protein